MSTDLSNLDPDIGTWANVIMAVEGMEEEVAARVSAGMDTESTRTLGLFARVLRAALNTCRECGNPQSADQPRHATYCSHHPSAIPASDSESR